MVGAFSTVCLSKTYGVEKRLLKSNAPSFGSPDEIPLAHATILIKGAGEKASAVAHRLYQAGLRKIVMTERPYPFAERRGVTFSEA